MALISRAHVFLGLTICGLALAGCTTPPPRAQLAELSFTDRPPIKLDVREIEVVQAYRPAGAAPNVEHLFHTSPAAAAARWAEQRLRAAGPLNRATFTVREASVVEVPLKQSEGVAGLLKTEQAERYDTRLVVEVRITSEPQGKSGELVAEVTRSRTVPEGLSWAERQAVWHEMTETLLRELDARLDEDIRKVFFTYLLL